MFPRLFLTIGIVHTVRRIYHHNTFENTHYKRVVPFYPDPPHAPGVLFGHHLNST